MAIEKEEHAILDNQKADQMREDTFVIHDQQHPAEQRIECHAEEHPVDLRIGQIIGDDDAAQQRGERQQQLVEGRDRSRMHTVDTRPADNVIKQYRNNNRFKNQRFSYE